MSSAWNYANLKKLSDLDLVKMMLSPHCSNRMMRVLRFVYKSRILNPLMVEACPDGVTVEVGCSYRESEEPIPTFSFINDFKELLEAV